MTDGNPSTERTTTELRSKIFRIVITEGVLMSRPLVLSLLIAVFTLFISVDAVFAQSSTATLSGTVLDEQ